MRKLLILIILFQAAAVAVSAETVIPELNPLKFQMDNGMTVILHEDHNAPVITVQCWVNAGSITEGEYAGSGISHFVEHMLFKGTEKRAVGEIGMEVKDIGGRTNAYTSFEKTVYYITAASGRLDRMLDIMSDALFNSSFDSGEVDKERDVILKEINIQKDDPDRYLGRVAWSTMFREHPYGLPVIGYEPVFKTISREDLLNYYRRMYVPGNMILVAAGDFDTGEARKMIEDYFGQPGSDIPEKYAPAAESPQLAYRERLEEFEVNTSRLFMGYHGPNLYSADLYVMDLIAVILGQGRTSRLYRALRDKKELVYSVNSWSYTPRYPGAFGIEAVLDEGNIAGAKQEILGQVEKLKKKPVGKKELEKAKIKIVNDRVYSMQTAEDIARVMGSDEFYAGSLDFTRKYIERIQQVSAGDIKRVMKKYFDYDNLTLITLTPAGEKENRKTEISLKKPEIKKIVLDNGITLLLREDRRLPIVAVRAAFQGGLRSEDETNNGICNLMRIVMQKGAGKRSSNEIAQALAARGTSIGSFSGKNSFGFSCSMMSRDLEAGLGIMADIIQNPSFPGEEIEKEKKAMLNAIRSYEDNILNATRKLFRKTMFGSHPYSFLEQGQEETVGKISREGLLSFYNTLVVPGNLVLAVYGDIDVEETAELVKDKFEFKNRATGKFTIEKRIPGFPETARKAVKQVDKHQTVLFLGYRGSDIYNSNRYAFEVLASVLNSQGGRLFESVRGREGLAYMVGAIDSIGVDPGTFVLYVVTEKEKKEKALSVMFEEIEKLKVEEISEKELSRAKAELTGRHAMNIQTNADLAFKTALDELYGLGYDYYQGYTEQVNAVTAQDIKKLATECFNPSKYSLVEVGN